MWRQTEKRCIYKSNDTKDRQQTTKSQDTGMEQLLPQRPQKELWDKCVLLMLPTLWYFVTPSKLIDYLNHPLWNSNSTGMALKNQRKIRVHPNNSTQKNSYLDVVRVMSQTFYTILKTSCAKGGKMAPSHHPTWLPYWVTWLSPRNFYLL